jgi:hypothetical protein
MPDISSQLSIEQNAGRLASAAVVRCSRIVMSLACSKVRRRETWRRIEAAIRYKQKDLLYRYISAARNVPIHFRDQVCTGYICAARIVGLLIPLLRFGVRLEPAIDGVPVKELKDGVPRRLIPRD